eukprot:14151127-Alexandrium_andersonii.AAC.1
MRGACLVPGGSRACLNCGQDGARCGHDADPGGEHALKCSRGGGTVRRRNAVRDTLLTWLASLGVTARREQDVPRWATESERGKAGRRVR